MSKSAITVLVFSGYLFLLGAILVIAPNALLRLFGIAETSEVWIRVVGVLVLLLGYYYANAARKGLRDFLRWTVVARTAVLLFFVGFVIAGLAPAVLVLFGAVDAVAAGWTALALRAEAD